MPPPNLNPHPNFASVEASRPNLDPSAAWTYTKSPNPGWRAGDGANEPQSHGIPHISIDPYAEGRAPRDNYRLLISAIVPRPIGFLSTRSADGQSTNLAPYSYTQLVNTDPPIFVVGFAGGLGEGDGSTGSRGAKDSIRNLVASGECVINIVSEHFVEAANACAVDAPFGVSEWALTGLTPAASEVVRASRVKEAVFSVEAKLVETKEFASRATPGKTTGVLAIVEGVRFWAREDAINEQRNQIDPQVLRPVARMGGITYVRVREGFEVPRATWDDFKADAEAKGIVQAKVEGQ